MGKPLLKRRVLPVELCAIEEDDALSILRHSGSSVGLPAGEGEPIHLYGTRGREYGGEV